MSSVFRTLWNPAGCLCAGVVLAIALTQTTVCAQPCLVIEARSPGGITPGEPIPNVQPRWPMSAMCFDTARGRVVGFGGDFGVMMYEYDGATWTRQQAATGTRTSPAMVYDQARGRTIVFGGLDGATNFSTAVNWMASWDGSNLTDITPTPLPTIWPPASIGSAAYDPIRQRCIFVLSPLSGSYQIWEWTGAAWERGPDVPADVNLSGAKVVFDELQGKLFIPGFDSATLDEVVLLYSPGATAAQGTVARATIQGTTYQGIAGAAYAYDSRHRRVFRMGGAVPGQPIQLNTVNVWDAAQSTWTREFATTTGDLLTRAGPLAAYDTTRHRVVLFGGQSSVSGGGSIERRDTLELYLNSDPVILQQPTSRTGLCSGTFSSLSFVPQVVSGIQYQWWKRAPGSLGFAPVPGANASIFPNGRAVQASDTGTYLCEVRTLAEAPGSGAMRFCGVSFTTPAELSVFDPPTLGTPQWSATTACPGAAVQIAVPGVGGTDVTLKLQKRTALGDWVDVLSATPSEPLFFLSNLSARDTGDYRVQASNPCSTLVSPITRLQVGATISGPIAAVGTPTLCIPLTIRVFAGLDPSGVSGVGTLSYRWYKDGAALSDSAHLSGTDSSSLSITSLGYADAGKYELRLTDSACPGDDRASFSLSLPESLPTYVQRDPNGPRPAPRQNHAMAFDASRGVTVLFGGLGRDQFGQNVAFDDTWEFDGTHWSQRSPPTSPGFRYAHATVYDSARQRVLLYGGSAPSCSVGCAPTPSSQVWEWNGQDWSLAWTFGALGGPAHSRAPFPALAYDPLAQRMVLYTGSNPSTDTYQGQTWEYNPASASWLQLSAEGPTTGNGTPAMYFDSSRNKRVMYAFAALPAFPATLFPGLYEWDGTHWLSTAADLSGAWQFNQQPFPYQPQATNTWVFNPLTRKGETGLSQVIPPGGGGTVSGTYTYQGAPADPVRVGWQNGYGLIGGAQVWDSARRCMVIFGGQNTFPGATNQGQPTNTTIERHFADAPIVLDQPVGVTICAGSSGPASIRVIAAGAPSLSYQWQKNTPIGSGTWVNVIDVPGQTVGSQSSRLQLSSASAASGLYRCVVSTSQCGNIVSASATVSGCIADFNCSGVVTVQDVFDYLNAWFVGIISADVNNSGSITVQDVFDFLNIWFAGCA